MMSNLGIISKKEAQQYQKSISQHREPFPSPPPILLMMLKMKPC